MAWGLDTSGQTNVPPGLSNAVAIAAGDKFSLALKSDGTVAAWGAGDRGQTNVPFGLTNVVAISAGSQHALARLTDGSVVAWGDNAKGQTNVPGTVKSGVAVAAGDVFSIAISGSAPPFITTPLFSRSVLLGRSNSFSATITGSGPLSLRWARNNVPIVGATQTVLSLNPVQLEDAGVYSIVATNEFGTASASASLVVTQIGLWGTNSTFDPKGFGIMDVPPTLTNIATISAGRVHVVALKNDGTVLAWGGPSQQVIQVPPDLSNVVQVAAGNGFSLALTAQGNVTGWGINSLVNLQNFPDLKNIKAIAAGSDHALALRKDGTVVAWGNNFYGQTNIPSQLSNVVCIAASFSHSMALRADGRIVSWGGNVPAVTNVPPDATNVVDLAGSSGVSVSHTLALRSDGSLLGWGYPNDAIYIPTNLSKVATMAASPLNNVACFTDGRVLSWGDNWSGRTNLPPDLSGAVDVAAAEGATAVLIGAGPPFITTPVPDRTVASGCAVLVGAYATGTLPISYQWRFEGKDIPGQTSPVLAIEKAGFNDSGKYDLVVSNRLGTSISPEMVLQVVPVLITDSPQSQNALVGSEANLSVVATGENLRYQWQFNGKNLTGATNNVLNLDPLFLSKVGTYRVLVSNDFGSATSREASLQVGQIALWGALPATPMLPPNLTNIIGIAAGVGLGTALSSDHILLPYNEPSVIGVAWHEYGMVLREDGSALSITYGGVQRDVLASSNIVSVCVGRTHSLGLTADGKVLAWGWDRFGETVVPPDLSNTVAIAAGEAHSVALLADGSVRVWGDNRFGQLNVPSNLTNVIAISARGMHSLALRSDGSAVSWGAYQNESYTQDLISPPAMTNVIAISAGSEHDLALTSEGNVVAWGLNPSGQTNVPASVAGNIIAISAGAFHSMALAAERAPLQRAPLLNPTVVPGKAASFAIESEVNRVYRLEFKDSLEDPDWKALPLVAGTGNPITLLDSAPSTVCRFYRVRRW